MENEVEFIGAEDFRSSKGGDFDFRFIMLMHLQRITRLSSKEFRGGFWQDRTKVINNIAVKEHYYVEDSREAYGNAVDCLADLLLPHFDQNMRRREFAINKELEDLEEEDESKYKDFKVKNKRKMFRALCSYLKKINYGVARKIRDTV